MLGGQALVPHQLVHGPLVQAPLLWLAQGPHPLPAPPCPKGPKPPPAAQPGPLPLLLPPAPPIHGAPVVCVTQDGAPELPKPALEAHEDQAEASVTVGVGWAEVQEAQSLVMEAGGP